MEALNRGYLDIFLNRYRTEIRHKYSKEGVLMIENKDNARNKIRTAVALSYEPEEDAPKVIAAGKGYMADKIIENAKAADIPMHRDEKLAESLAKLDIGAYIPPELYEVVAEILVFVDKMDRIKEKLDR